ncbi:MAG TPA: galactokinase [Terriglobia bacterium]|jgi:galactokinase|nr:galactokinase [Terriglobia bacterium]
MDQPGELRKRFEALYGHRPRVFRAPGRVNLIGEHTDYNDGFVLPAAIDFYTWVALSSRSDRKLVLSSENFPGIAEYELDSPNHHRRHEWSDYVYGVVLVLERAGKRLRGADVLVAGEIPIGAGLSSSAAIEVATGYALLENSGHPVERVELAKLCQRAENEFVGVRSGIMDQFISCFGRTGQALLLDCRSLEYSLVALPGGISLVICNTMVKHELAGGEYNQRRSECEAGVRLLAEHMPEVRALRDVTLADLEKYGSALPPVVYRRCRHVVSENGRVLEAVRALGAGDLATVGALMAESHRSLRDDYEVSCAELDLLVDLAEQTEGVYGARMTGGGFGGCTINLVRSESVDAFRQTVARGYQERTGGAPEIYVTGAAEGVAELDPP